MTACWEPGTQYNHGDVVEYEGHRYKIIQPHTSQSDWAPSLVPALWGRLQDDDHVQGGNHDSQHSNQGYNKPPPANYQPPQEHYPAPPPQQEVKIHKEEEEKHWYDLDEERKKQLKIGGGLALGLGLLGAGFAVYKHHEKSEEEKEAETWALQNWAREAQARRNQYKQSGLVGPAMWIYNEGKDIPSNAILAGKDETTGWKLYICRAPVDGGIQLGKASDVFQKGAVIGYKNDEIHLAQYEILVGNMNGLRWVSGSGRFNLSALGGARPVEGGREKNGKPLYVARAYHNKCTHPGKVGEHLDGCYIPFDDKEKQVDQYEVLVYA